MNRPLNAKTNLQLISLQKARVALANVRQNRNRNSHGKENGASVRRIKTYRLNRLQIQQEKLPMKVQLPEMQSMNG
jgi:hypothetical protein